LRIEIFFISIQLCIQYIKAISHKKLLHGNYLATVYSIMVD